MAASPMVASTSAGDARVGGPEQSASPASVQVVRAQSDTPATPNQNEHVPSADAGGANNAPTEAPPLSAPAPARAAASAPAAPEPSSASTAAPARSNGLHAAEDAASAAPQKAVDPTPDPAAPFPTLPTTTTTPTAATGSPVHAGGTAAPAAQIGPALLTLAKTADGNRQITVQLHPADLGMVQVRIERAASGLTQIDITADKPETLLALQRDQPALHRTLDDAGIPVAGRTVSFHSSQPAPAPASASSGSNASGQGNGNHTAGGRANTPADGGGGSSGGGRGGYPTPESLRWPGSRPSNSAPGSAATATPADARTSRIGLDITA